jgi:CubicO group peptidase (beta-lactamase class C family)
VKEKKGRVRWNRSISPVDHLAELRPPRFSHKPGTFWYYNNWDFNALGAIYEHARQSSIYDAFEREIARLEAGDDLSCSIAML